MRAKNCCIGFSGILLKGLGYDMNDMKGHTLGLCHACMLGRMKVFPVPASISNKVYGIFELLSVDIVPMNKTAIRGFNYIALFVDKATSMPLMVLMPVSYTHLTLPTKRIV